MSDRHTIFAAPEYQLCRPGLNPGPRATRRCDSGSIDSTGLQVVRLRPNIGAEIRGADLAAGITAAQAADIRAALNAQRT